MDSKSDAENFYDPFEGYASCPDTQRAYASRSKENQTNWMQKSEDTIREFIDKFDSFENFHDAYEYLANARHQIAVDLKQRTDEGRTDYYGCLRKEGDHMRQSISSGDGEQFWKWQKKKIFELTYKLLEPVKQINLSDVNPGYIYENDYITCLKENVFVDDKQATYYCITIKFPATLSPPNIMHASSLSQIELYDFADNDKFNLIRIEYTPIDNSTIVGNFKVIDHYYQSMINWKSEKGLESFLIDSAKIAYLTANFLFVKQGNSGIIEWMTRAIAFKHGIDLGKFNSTEGISWDFKAVLTPNINEYVQWYKSKLFIKCELLPTSENVKKFSFNMKK